MTTRSNAASGGEHSIRIVADIWPSSSTTYDEYCLFINIITAFTLLNNKTITTVWLPLMLVGRASTASSSNLHATQVSLARLPRWRTKIVNSSELQSARVKIRRVSDDHLDKFNNGLQIAFLNEKQHNAQNNFGWDMPEVGSLPLLTYIILFCGKIHY